MIKFFRKIRQQVLMEGKTSKYFKYAIGEIVLVVIGILIALQINNWNESRKQKSEFKDTLEQLYSSLFYDNEYFNFQLRTYMDQIKIIDSLLLKSDSISDHSLPYLVYATTVNHMEYNSETTFHSQKLTSSPSNPIQKELVKQISHYTSSLKNLQNTDQKKIQNALDEINLAYPNSENINNGWNISDTTYYNNEDILNLRALFSTKKFQTLLKNERINSAGRVLQSNAFASITQSILNSIKIHFPEIELRYLDVGIIGSAINGWDVDGFKSTPMNLTNVENQIWELKLFLKKGEVKFRCKDSWAQNWGGNSFPKGNAEIDGNDIIIDSPGMYSITLDLTQGTFEFIKLDD